ncbi:hypothetical protein TMatcc_003482 [Talaromyces marneffei ATCC 18224]
MVSPLTKRKKRSPTLLRRILRSQLIAIFSRRQRYGNLYMLSLDSECEWPHVDFVAVTYRSLLSRLA